MYKGSGIGCQSEFFFHIVITWQAHMSYVLCVLCIQSGGSHIKHYRHFVSGDHVDMF